jgi:hypothetical protein
MKESILRKLVLLLLLSTIVCILWAVGANARKRVELEKSKELNQRLEKLTLANTVITDNLKTIQNRIAELKQKEFELKSNLEKQQEEKQLLKQKIEGQTEDSEELELLKQTNNSLGEELLRLKEQDLALRQEIELLKAGSKQTKTKDKDQTEKDSKTENSPANFGW